MPPDLQDRVYRPGKDGPVPNVDIENPRPPTFTSGDWELVDKEEEIVTDQ